MRDTSQRRITCKDDNDGYIARPSPSRAGSLPLIADDLALDFANTESGRGFPSHQNHLREAANVVGMAEAREGAAGRGGRLAAGSSVSSAPISPRIS